MVWVTMYLPYWYIIRPAILKSGGIPQLTETVFNLNVAALVLTTLAGYVLNDWFDRDIDAINKPDRVFWGRFVSPGTALLVYAALVTGVHILAVLIDQKLDSMSRWPLWVYPGLSILLILYAWKLKCTPLSGNLLVSFLCGTVPVITMLPEERILCITSFYAPELIESAKTMVWTYAFFAFLLNFFREQVKDLEDYKGDAACGCATLPVIKGLAFARKPAIVTGAVTTFFTGLLVNFWMANSAPIWQIYAGVATLLIPSGSVTVILAFTRNRKGYSYSSTIIKLIMFSGTILLIRF